MGWPQITVAVLMVLSAGGTLARYGEHKRGYYGWADWADLALIAWLLYMGGFWRT